MRRWRPSPLLHASIALHAVLAAALALRPGWWPWLLAALLADHAALAAAGLWPRSTLLGPNMTRLPASAAARGEVAITIDDGPDPEVTPRVLAVLRQYGARATFFCIGDRALAHPELCRAIVAEGHEIANHGQRHPHLASLMGPGGWLREIGEGQRTLQRVAGATPRYYRAVAGLRNPMLDPVLHGLGLRLATWTRRGFDTRCASPRRVLDRLLDGLAAGDILLLHDGHGARGADGEPVVLAVLEGVLEALRQRGLRPVTLTRACIGSD